MSYELQLAAKAHELAETLRDKLDTVEEFLGPDFKALVEKKAQEKVVAAQAAAPLLDLTPEEKQAILSARLAIKQAVDEKNAAPAA